MHGIDSNIGQIEREQASVAGLDLLPNVADATSRPQQSLTEPDPSYEQAGQGAEDFGLVHTPMGLRPGVGVGLLHERQPESVPDVCPMSRSTTVNTGLTRIQKAARPRAVSPGQPVFSPCFTQ